MTRLSTLAIFTAMACAVAAEPPAPQQGKTDRFRVVCDARLTITANGREQEQKLITHAAYDYAWTRTGATRTLRMESLGFDLNMGTQEIMKISMNRTGITGTQGGKKIDVKFEDAPEERRKVLIAMFDSPICTLELDSTGKERKRTVVDRRGPLGVFDNGSIANCTMFHPWYSPDKEEWQADVAISAGESVAQGPLTYKKIAGGKAGQQLVKLSGTLSADNVKDRNGNTIKDGKYTVSGRQTYDTTRKEWIAGQMTMDLAFKMVRDGKELGIAKGTMAVTFEMLPEKK